MGACHATERIHASNTRKSLKKQSTTPSSPSTEKNHKTKEDSGLDLSGESLPNADLYVTNLNISPSLVIFFGTFYKKRLTMIQNSDTFLGNSSKREVFIQKLASLNGIDVDTAHIWVKAYTDYMILMAWLYFAVEEKEMYAPFAIQQTQLLHLSYPSDYKAVCSLITEGKSFIHYSPRKTVCNNQDIDLIETSYDEARESIMIYLYESQQINLPNTSEVEQIKEIWEPFYETFIKIEYSFYLGKSNNKTSKSAIQKAISGISTNNHNFSLASEGASLLRASLNLSFNYGTEGNTNILSTMADSISEEEKNVARIVDEIKFPIGFTHLLSWEQVIPMNEAQEWIVEYKKFIFNNITGKSSSNVVNEKIKQVWSLHMTFTRNYQKFFVEHLTKNNLKMTVNFEGIVEENVNNKTYVNFYSDIVKKQEELLNIKLANALIE